MGRIEPAQGNQKLNKVYELQQTYQMSRTESKTHAFEVQLMLSRPQ